MIFKKLGIIFIFFILFLIVNLIFSEFYFAKLNQTDYKHNLFPEENTKYDYVVTGNSQPNEGIYFDFFDEYNGLNLALPGQSVDLDYRMYESFQKYMDSETKILISLTFFSFCDRQEKPFFQYQSFFDVEISFEERIINEYLPFFGVNNFLNSINQITSENVPNEIEYPKDINQWTIDGENRYLKHARISQCSEELFEENLLIIENLFKENIQNNREVYILIMPYHKSYWNNLISNKIVYDEFYDNINYLSEKYNAQILDYSTDSRFYEDMNLFRNWDHLNNLGAKKFTPILIDDIKN